MHYCGTACPGRIEPHVCGQQPSYISDGVIIRTPPLPNPHPFQGFEKAMLEKMDEILEMLKFYGED